LNKREKEQNMIDQAKTAEQQDTSAAARKMPPTFDPAYVQGTVKPFFLGAIYQGERPLLPMMPLSWLCESADVSPRGRLVRYRILGRERARCGSWVGL